MCYDIKTSIIALLVNILSCIILLFYSKNNPLSLQLKTISLFYLYIGVMQFWDMIFWAYPANTTINQCSTKAAMIWSHFEPIVLGLLIIFVMREKLTRFSSAVFYVYIICAILYSIYVYGKLKGTKQIEKTEGSLYWEWTDHTEFKVYFYSIFMFTVIVLVYSHFSGWIRNVNMISIVGLFIFSWYKYSIKKSTGRFWCYFGAFIPLIYVFILFI